MIGKLTAATFLLLGLTTAADAQIVQFGPYQPGYRVQYHPYQPPTLQSFRPVLPTERFVPVQPTFYPQPVGHLHGWKSKDLERHVEHVIRVSLGPCVDDVDVDVDTRRGRIEVDVELRHRHPGAENQVRHVLYSLPELRGFQIRVEVDD